MKKLFALIMTVISVSVVCAQTNNKPVQMQMPEMVIMPDGSKVPFKSIDSIKKVLGTGDLVISPQEDGYHIHAGMSKSKLLENENNQNSLLNQTAPYFKFKDLRGKQYSLSELKGKVVVLNFWFTNCGGCITEMPDLNILLKKYTGKNVVLLAITFDDSKKVKAFLKKHEFKFTIIPEARQTCNDYKIYGYPTSMVIDNHGIIRFINCSVDGDIKKLLQQAIDPLLKV